MVKAVQVSRSGIVRVALVSIAMLAVPAIVHAQTGCTDSPENPTAVLALVGSAGALFSTVRRHLKGRRESTRK